MIQVFLFGAFKYPRELTWMMGVLLLFLTLGMAFTGQVLRFDQDAYWGLGIGAAITGRTPLIGPEVVQLLLGGPIIGAATLSRFFALHVFVIPGSADRASIGLHLFLVLQPRHQRVADAGTPGESRRRTGATTRHSSARRRRVLPGCRTSAIWCSPVS